MLPPRRNPLFGLDGARPVAGDLGAGAGWLGAARIAHSTAGRPHRSCPGKAAGHQRPRCNELNAPRFRPWPSPARYSATGLGQPRFDVGPPDCGRAPHSPLDLSRRRPVWSCLGGSDWRQPSYARPGGAVPFGTKEANFAWAALRNAVLACCARVEGSSTQAALPAAPARRKGPCLQHPGP